MMRKINYFSFATILSMGMCLSGVPAAAAISLQFPSTAAMNDAMNAMNQELPLIPLEKSLFPITPPAEVNATTLGSAASSHQVANTLVRGLLIANRTREIGYYAPLSYRVQGLVRRLRRGESMTSASERTRVPQSVVTRLLDLGKAETALLLNVPESQGITLAHSLANALVRGLLIANRTGEIGYGAPLSYRVQNVVRRLRRGDPLTLASRRAKVSNTIVDRLLELGKYSTPIN
jgi:hypothetical protein